MAKYHYAKEILFRLIRRGVSLKFQVIRLEQSTHEGLRAMT